MRDPTLFPLITPELLTGSAPLPRPAGPVRLALGAVAERDRPALLQHCFAKFGFHYQVDPLPDVPFDLDVAINALPGLFVAIVPAGWNQLVQSGRHVGAEPGFEFNGADRGRAPHVEYVHHARPDAGVRHRRSHSLGKVLHVAVSPGCD